jgi:hypothetical protein
MMIGWLPAAALNGIDTSGRVISACAEAEGGCAWLLGWRLEPRDRLHAGTILDLAWFGSRVNEAFCSVDPTPSPMTSHVRLEVSTWSMGNQVTGCRGYVASAVGA